MKKLLLLCLITFSTSSFSVDRNEPVPGWTNKSWPERAFTSLESAVSDLVGFRVPASLIVFALGVRIGASLEDPAIAALAATTAAGSILYNFISYQRRQILLHRDMAGAVERARARNDIRVVNGYLVFGEEFVREVHQIRNEYGLPND